MKNADLVGTTWIGNAGLLEKEGIIGVFASDRSDSLMAWKRDQWAIGEGRKRRTIVGLFRTVSERSILKLFLSNGGSAVWVVGYKLPTMYSRTCSRAFKEGRLLVVSCFWIERGIYGTVAYCALMVQRWATILVFWAPSQRGFLPQIRNRARKNGKNVILM